MRQQRHLFLALAAILCIALLLFQGIAWFLAKQAAEEELVLSAERIRSVLMSLRRVYQHAFIDSGLPLNEKTLPFLPAFAMTKIADELANFDATGFSFNNVSERARNHHNQADAEELKAIAFFRENPKAERFTANIVDADGRKKLLYARPIWVEGHCLKCHGKAEDAPPSIRERYADAYGYKVGELRGVLSIKLPRDQVDALAGLPNRPALVERIQLAIATSHRGKEQAALVLLNLSGFKRINEARGEAFGNQVLVAIGQRLVQHLRESDFIARTYGDEFALLLNGLEPQADMGMHQILAILRKLQETLARPLSIAGEELALSACLGITALPVST